MNKKILFVILIIIFDLLKKKNDDASRLISNQINIQHLAKKLDW
jgi:hypothetical protein